MASVRPPLTAEAGTTPRPVGIGVDRARYQRVHCAAIPGGRDAPTHRPVANTVQICVDGLAGYGNKGDTNEGWLYVKETMSQIRAKEMSQKRVTDFYIPITVAYQSFLKRRVYISITSLGL